MHSRGPRPAPDAPSSVDELEHPAYGRAYPPAAYARGGYPQSHISTFAPGPFAGDPRHSGAIMPFQNPAAYPQYPPANPFSPVGDPRTSGYFAHSPGGHMPYTGHELAPYGPPQAYAYGGYPFPPGMDPRFFEYPQSTSAPPEKSKTPAPVDPEVAKQQMALEAQLAQLKLEKSARETADKLAREAEEAKKAADIRVAEEITKARMKVLEEAAAAEEKAKADAEAKKAADARIAEEVTKARIKVLEEAAAAEEAAKKAAEQAKIDAENAKKKEAELKIKIENELKAKAEKEAKEAAAKAPPPAEKQKPIRFKDAVGRKFSFPFHLCATWAGMEDLIKQAFMHVEVIGPHVADGHYDLVGPNGEIILPQVWETMIEPDWAITMHMWPMPERPKPPPDDPIIIDGGMPGMRHGRARRERPGPPPPGDRPRGPPGMTPGVEIIDNPPKKKKSSNRSSGIWGWGSSSKSKGKR